MVLELMACPMCGGSDSDGCPGCWGHGYVPIDADASDEGEVRAADECPECLRGWRDVARL